MDPNAARAHMIEKANLVLAHVTPMGEAPYDGAFAAVELAEAVHDLDEWLRSGGFFPDAWAPPSVIRPQGANYGRKQDVDIHTDGTARAAAAYRHSTSAQGPRKEVDDERPRVDGTMCEYTMRDQDGLYDGACTLDRGHDGPHA